MLSFFKIRNLRPAAPTFKWLILNIPYIFWNLKPLITIYGKLPPKRDGIKIDQLCQARNNSPRPAYWPDQYPDKHS